MAAKSRTKAKTIDDYLAALTDNQRIALEKLRKTILAAAPNAEECISYQLAAFRNDGKMLVALGATANHCAFYLMSSTAAAAHKDELKNYDTSKGTIRFQPDKPLPAALVRKLVKARIAEDAIGGPNSAPRSVDVKRFAKPNRKQVAKSEPGELQTDPAVVAFMRELVHPRKKELEAVRQLILGASPEIREGIKWNSPSFRTTDYFATINVLGKDRLRLILHTGAKVKSSASKGLKITDPEGLLEWLAKDRCLVSFSDARDVEAKGAALRKIVREWIQQL